VYIKCHLKFYVGFTKELRVNNNNNKYHYYYYYYYYTDFSLFNVNCKTCNCPSAGCTLAANAIGSGFDVFVGISVLIYDLFVFDNFSK
jgi:hypothetical protein